MRIRRSLFLSGLAASVISHGTFGGGLSPRFQPLPAGAVKPGGWIREQMRQDVTNGIAAHFLELCPRYGVRTYRQKDANLGCGEMTGNWADGFIRMACLSGEPEARKKADQFVRDVLQTRESDGYLGNVKADRRYRNAVTGELWMQSRLYMALLAYYELTGDREVLNAVKTATRLTMSKYGPANRPFHRTAAERAAAKGRPVQTWGLMFVDVLEWLYRLTGDRAYVRFARFLYDDFSSATDIDDRDDQIQHLLEMKYPLFWHGAHTVAQLRVPLFLAYAGAGDLYGRAAECGFRKLRKHIVPSGSCTSDERIDNHRPTARQYYEYCTTTELCSTLESALAKTGRPEYGDMIECAVFNAAQAARTPDGKLISYLTADTRISATEDHDFPYTGKRRCKLSPAHDVGGACCSANSVKVMPYYVCSMWMRSSDGGLAALLFGPCRVRAEVKNVPVTIDEETAYPFGDRVRFVVSPEKPVAFPLTVRIPGWAGKVDLDAPGAQVESRGGLRIITRTWRKGDEVTLTFQNPIRLKRLVDGDVCLYRGPLLFVQAWPSRMVRLTRRRFRVPGFGEYDVLPRWPRYDRSPSYVDCTAKGYGFTVSHPAGGDVLHPYAKPPIVLEGDFRSASRKGGFRKRSRLVPIGSALLRFASFRVWPFDDAYFGR